VRIFLGCFLTPASAQALTESFRRLVATVPGMRPVPVANLHVTLHFLGSVPADRVDQIRALVEGLPATGISTRVLALTGFPKPARARVLVARLDDPDGQLLHWHGMLARRWPTGETRRFDPHATLARSRSPVRLPVLPEIGDLAVALEPPAAYVSETLPEGARYRLLG